jgi:hypothetical protein
MYRRLQTLIHNGYVTQVSCIHIPSRKLITGDGHGSNRAHAVNKFQFHNPAGSMQFEQKLARMTFIKG